MGSYKENPVHGVSCCIRLHWGCGVGTGLRLVGGEAPLYALLSPMWAVPGAARRVCFGGHGGAGHAELVEGNQVVVGDPCCVYV